MKIDIVSPCYSPIATSTSTNTLDRAVAQAQDSDGYTPLMEAAAQGHLPVAKQLLRAHADTAMVNKVCMYKTLTEE